MEGQLSPKGTMRPGNSTGLKRYSAVSRSRRLAMWAQGRLRFTRNEVEIPVLGILQ
jgi:hypothetical protein